MLILWGLSFLKLSLFLKNYLISPITLYRGKAFLQSIRMNVAIPGKMCGIVYDDIQ
jgi:hypothetical protein